MTSILPTPANTQGPPSSEQAGQQLNVDYENFLQLLTAQISNQDPLAPMESTEFVSQLAQLSQVEQSIQTNANLEAISASLAVNMTRSDLLLLDRQVLVESDRVRLGENGATLGYQLPENAEQVSVAIEGPGGLVMRRMSGVSGEAGIRHEMVWDGLTDAGTPAVRGAVYTMNVTGVDADGNQITGTPLAVAQVTSVALDGGQSTLKLDNDTTAQAQDVLTVVGQ